jgi:hypothetical protein
MKTNQPASQGPSGDYASPVSIGDNLVMVTRTGATHIVKASDSYEKIRENSFEGDNSRFNATPAISNGQMFIRSDKKLYCIAKSENQEKAE